MGRFWLSSDGSGWALDGIKTLKRKPVNTSTYRSNIRWSIWASIAQSRSLFGDSNNAKTLRHCLYADHRVCAMDRAMAVWAKHREVFHMRFHDTFCFRKREPMMNFKNVAREFAKLIVLTGARFAEELALVPEAKVSLLFLGELRVPFTSEMRNKLTILDHQFGFGILKFLTSTGIHAATLVRDRRLARRVSRAAPASPQIVQDVVSGRLLDDRRAPPIRHDRRPAQLAGVLCRPRHAR